MSVEIAKVIWKNKNYVDVGKHLLLTETEYDRAIGRMIRFHKDQQGVVNPSHFGGGWTPTKELIKHYGKKEID